MTIYKTVLKLLQTNKTPLLIGVAITAFITLTQSGNIREEQSTAQNTKVAILSDDNSTVVQGLEDHLAEEQQLVTLSDTSDEAIDDALYFGEVAYILIIPATFTEQLEAGEMPKLTAKTRPDTFSKVLVDSTINQFLNTYLLYQDAQPSLSQAELVTQTTETFQNKQQFQLDAAYNQKNNQTIAASFINLLAYGLFSTIFSAYALVNGAFNRIPIKFRNNCSPISRRKLNRRISLANLSYAILVTLMFSVFVLYFSKITDMQVLSLFILNILTFFLTMVTFSTMITNLIKSADTISGINNVFILGSCFISGVFVPSEILPDIVNKIAAFTPTYWFVQNNHLIAQQTMYTRSFYNTLGLNLFILIAFALAFMIIQFINLRERGSAILNKSKRTAR
ncbi:ABC transporter permease [Enterococcus saccharolyticus]|uniref:ABC transporter permease n=1 Tax=Enterococcus saccharolyticus TaxID=41997 RepID=UPI001E328E19|nr:ABC transporter permease [Enterococcus saccharolyticus]MCD5001867.1 ABC transporter permease [Enterococcus saccharolyticus]